MNSETLISLPNSSASKPPYPSPTQSFPAPPSHFDRLQPMLDSFPTTAKPSKWLRRLRSSRGFPDSDNINLEHFLSNSLQKNDPQTCTDSAPTDKTPHPDENSIADKHHDSEGTQGLDAINNALSELFHMGELQDLSRIKRKKSCRKQQCPKICVVSTNSDVHSVPVRNDKVSSPLPLTLSNRRKLKLKEANQELKVTMDHVQEEEEKCDWDLSAYSQTEVTVIDTSVPSWKFEKILYRRKNVWKVGDKKGKGLMISDRKKRKESLNENGVVVKKKLKLLSSSSMSGDAGEGREKMKKKKKKKKKQKRLQMCSSSREYKQEAIVRSKSAQGHDQGKMMVAAYEKEGLGGRSNC